MSSTLDLITDALDDIGISGINGPQGEDVAKGLRKFNARGSNWNTQERFKKFERQQTFTFATSKQSYLIGNGANTPVPDFVVATGNQPVKIDHGNWIVAGTAPLITFPLEIIPVDDYEEIRLPGLSNSWPYGLYYQRTTANGNGTIWPWPYPTEIADSLQLFWWDQFTQVAIADIALELSWPEGYELAFTLTLAEDLCLPFQKTASADLTKAAAMARADIASLNKVSPRLDTSDQSDWPGNWRRGWLGWRRS